MLKQRTLKFLIVLVVTYGLLLLPGAIWPSYFDSGAGLLLGAPFLAIYLFHKAGIPGLLEHDGLCGWGWCAPTTFGWVFLLLFWVAVTWVVAWILASLTSRAKSG